MGWDGMGFKQSIDFEILANKAKTQSGWFFCHINDTKYYSYRS